MLLMIVFVLYNLLFLAKNSPTLVFIISIQALSHQEAVVDL